MTDHRPTILVLAHDLKTQEYYRQMLLDRYRVISVLKEESTHEWIPQADGVILDFPLSEQKMANIQVQCQHTPVLIASESRTETHPTLNLKQNDQTRSTFPLQISKPINKDLLLSALESALINTLYSSPPQFNQGD